LGDRKSIWRFWPVKKVGWFVGEQFGWSFAYLIAPVVTTTSITLSSNKIQNRNILVPANPRATAFLFIFIYADCL